MLNGISDEQLQAVVDLVEAGNTDDLRDELNRLQDERYNHLLRKVGILTRALYESMDSLNIAGQGESRVQDASEKLIYVMETTEEAAGKVLDAVDTAQPIAQRLQANADGLRDTWLKLGHKQLNLEEFKSFYTDLGGFLSGAVEDSHQLNEILHNIVMAQGFQDLTGQVLQKVIQMVRELEGGLVGLLAHAADLDPEGANKAQVLAGSDDLSAGVGPQTRKQDDVVSGQGDVDDLLSSLGL